MSDLFIETYRQITLRIKEGTLDVILKSEGLCYKYELKCAADTIITICSLMRTELTEELLLCLRRKTGELTEEL